jgi:hypothetical protein
MSIAGPSSTTTSPPGDWRGSTGRNDLSQRQLWLLRDMLNRSDASPANLQTLEEIPVNRSWLWGEATSSAITLPSEESSGRNNNASPTTKKRRYSRLGMSGLRDMLRSLARSHLHQPPPIIPPVVPFRPGSSASTSASSSYNDDQSAANPDITTPSVRTSSSFGTAPALTHHKSPRRPSIASIFRFAQKSKPSPPPAAASTESHRPPQQHVLHSYSSGSDLASRDAEDEEEDEDWDHIDAVEDLGELNGTATVRGRRTKLHRPEAEGEHKQKVLSTSQSSLSLWADSPSTASRSQVSLASLTTTTTCSPQPQVTSYLRPTRLSNVEETAEAHLDGGGQNGSARVVDGGSKSPRRRSVRRLTGSVRSAPPPTPTLMPTQDGRSLALSLTPETIRPLLENARKVHAMCTECVGELRALLAYRP